MNFLHLPVGSRFTLAREKDGTIYTKENDNKNNNATYNNAGIITTITIHGCSQVKMVGEIDTQEFDLKVIRERRHLTRKELSVKSGVHEQTIEKLESGKNNPYDAKMTTLIKLAKALGCRVKDFYPCEKVI